MTTAGQAAEATVSLVTQEQQVATLEVTRGEDETQGGKALPSATADADAPRATQLSRRWEPLAHTQKRQWEEYLDIQSPFQALEGLNS